MRYTVKTSGNICHYQFANIMENEVNDIEFGEMDYHALEETINEKVQSNIKRDNQRAKA